ncbi:MAG: class I SAM-dependent methyltransferase [Candidatus Zixiibacteriota bacterium]|nr:MAG: class I SAM-dependent methyltransferase [candidate division Zixibacteria bacterium]
MNHNKMKDLYAESTRNGGFYDHLMGEYDQMMDWESRLARETPFLEKVIAEYKVKSVLDAGCGTGRHCFHFLTLGVEEVVGADASEKVIEVARARAQAVGGETRFVQAEFTELAHKVGGSFNLVTCLGNSLSHLLTYDDLELTLSNFRQLTTSHGAVLVHLMNWDRRLARQDRFIPPKGYPTAEGEKLFFRFFDFHEELVTMNLVIFQKEEGPDLKWSHRVISTTLRPWRREILLMALDDAGLKLEREYGGLDASPYHLMNSPDFVFLTRRA